MLRFLHISDLHVGRRGMLDDETFVLNQILDIAAAERVNGILIAGDLYDRAVPPSDAVFLMDRFLTQAAFEAPVFAVCGNHDSPERLAFGSDLMHRSGVYISPVYDGYLEPVQVGSADIWMLPFLRPSRVRQVFPDEAENIRSEADAAACALSHVPADPRRINVLVTHLFVAGCERSESESLYAGGAGAVPAELFESFDYVALGHLHRAQNAGARIRYCGSPLAWDFSERDQEKSVTIAELSGHDLNIRTIPLRPLHPLVQLEGDFRTLCSSGFVQAQENREMNRYKIVLTDSVPVPDAAARLRKIYPGLEQVQQPAWSGSTAPGISADTDVERLDPAALLGRFYREMNGQDLSPEQSAYLKKRMAEEENGDGEDGKEAAR